MNNKAVYIDSGVENITLHLYENNDLKESKVIFNNDDIHNLYKEQGVLDLIEKFDGDLYFTGKLSEVSKNVLKRGDHILASAAFWGAAKLLLKYEAAKTAIVDLSASGYTIIAVNEKGELLDDTLIVNPRCGAGSGVNLSRILEKLDIEKTSVDTLLIDFVGVKGAEERKKISTRTDRCGVFSSSATISDKNQGIPLEHALAVTMKSEVKKTCDRVPDNLDIVHLTGGVFKWQYCRDCAEDFLKEKGVKKVVYDDSQDLIIRGMKYLVQELGTDFKHRSGKQLRKSDSYVEASVFNEIKKEYEEANLYLRLPDDKLKSLEGSSIANEPVNIGLDIGSTMAKMVMTNAENGDLLFKNSYDNHGDTIETIKYIFSDLKTLGIASLNIQNIGITGSGRYQVQKTLRAIYPHLDDRISVLVENYAHARGSIDYAKNHIEYLKAKGIKDVNDEFCILIDIGGEDTKISSISLEKEELFDNAMNVKCSAGTGSLMDTLKALFSIEKVADAYSLAQNAEKAYGINATCAVFLMENARKMQAEGYGRDEILASCAHAIVENMARTLWDQVDFPPNSVVLLHGQTMLSDPLPLAVTNRIQDYTASKTYTLVPPLPGHRACIGLIRSIEKENKPLISESCQLDELINLTFNKRIFTCFGVACGDKDARCSRTLLKGDEDGGDIKLKLGGCTAINELEAAKESGKGASDAPDAYRDIWRFISDRLPQSDAENRLVIPRSFAVSEKSFFLGKIFENLGIPVHVDNVQDVDVITGQPYFKIDTCAPNIGATGQYIRLAQEKHGMILVPQIGFLDTGGVSLGRTCTTNQGGVFIAQHFAEMEHSEGNFFPFHLSLEDPKPESLADQLKVPLKPLFEFYGKDVSREELVKAIAEAEEMQLALQEEVVDLTATYLEKAIDDKKNISLVMGREYILNPGIYDSHIGKLLRDKDVVALPSYCFDVNLEKSYSYIYWRNPHDILTKVDAIAKKNFHEIIKSEKLNTLMKKIEKGETSTKLSVVTVSTFRCGPDTVTLPTLSEITKDMPSLLIQSDAMIAELAHLENRVNTHLNQLEQQLYEELHQETAEPFDIEVFNDFRLDALDMKNDVLYMPNMSDNRLLTSIFRAIGVTVIDNFDDATYDLEAKSKTGRKYVGDSVCVPLASVFADYLAAINDFIHKKNTNDPQVEGKNRLVLFMHGGDGPCRLGQYVELFKLSFYRIYGIPINFKVNNNEPFEGIKILENLSSGLLNVDDYTAQVEKWAGSQAYQVVILHGIVHSMYLRAGEMCETHEQYEAMKQDYYDLKDSLQYIAEFEAKPSDAMINIVSFFDKHIPKLGGVAQYFAFGLWRNNGYRKHLKKFSKKWILPQEKKGYEPKIKIHVDGEIYMRVAQIDDIFKSLTDSLGFRTFELSTVPIWCFFENILEQRILLANEDIAQYNLSLANTDDPAKQKEFKDLLKNRHEILANTKKDISNFRNVLARPMYKAAALKFPHPMANVFDAARSVVPTLKPFGELVPYVGETIMNLREGKDLVLNVAPEGCMVSSMGEILSPKILDVVDREGARIQYLFSNEGEVDSDLLRLALLKALGPEGFYRN